MGEKEGKGLVKGGWDTAQVILIRQNLVKGRVIGGKKGVWQR